MTSANSSTSSVAQADPTIAAAVRAAAERIAAAGSDTPRLDAELLAAEALGRDRNWLLAHGTDAFEPEAADRFAVLVARREQREPVAYLLGRKGFRRLELAVDPRVLIPRPESEFVVDAVLDAISALAAAGTVPVTVVDVGTGSGAIALAIADEAGSTADVWATDASTDALAVARANADTLDLPVQLCHGDLLDALPTAVAPHIVASNLPYIAPEDASSLMPDVVGFEPHMALFGPPGDAVALIRSLAGQARERLAAGGTIALEVGHDQHQQVINVLQNDGFLDIRSVPDLQGHQRVVTGRIADRG